ncbi:MAG: glycosyltransferase family 39 protein [Candidatus Hydrogenedentes bacterium]|nr:glycosyltransferase family 39 protein [Candidatus Hydrogenedentota bacterium]
MNRYRNRFIAITLALTVGRILLAATFPLTGDEAYHWEWSRHLAFGYYDHPPMTAWIIFLGTSLLGINELGVRAGSVLLMTLSACLCYRLAALSSGDERQGFWAGMLFHLVPILNVYFLYSSTDPASLFFWTLCIYAYHRAIFGAHPARWYAFGLVLGLGLMSKFIHVLFIPAGALYLLLSREHRPLLWSRGPWLGGLVGLVMLLPFFIWNAQHDWATFAFNLSERHGESAGLQSFGEFWLFQSLNVSPVLFVLYLGIMLGLWQRGLRGNSEDLFWACISSTVFLFFLAVAFAKPVGTYWTTAGYIGACIAVPRVVFADDAGGLRRLWRPALITACASLIFLYGILLTWQYAPKVIARISNADLYWHVGNEETGQEVARRLEAAPDIFLITPGYGMCATLGFHTPGHPQFRLFQGHSVYGRNYQYWDNGFAGEMGRDALWVYGSAPGESTLAGLAACFESIGPVQTFPIYSKGEHIRDFYFVECKKLLRYIP